MSKIIEKQIRETIDRAKAGFSFEDFKQAKTRQRKSLQDMKFLNRYYGRKFSHEKAYLDFIVTKNVQLTTSLDAYFQSGKAEEDYSPTSYSYMAVQDFKNMFIVIANNHILMKQLFSSGFDYQGRIILRNTIELTETCIGILGDEEFYKHFKSLNDPDEKALYKSVKFATSMKVTNKVLKYFRNYNNVNLPFELWEEYIRIRKEFYQETSRNVHCNYLYVMLNAYVGNTGEENMRIRNLGGVINTATKSNITKLALYDSLSYQVILVLLIEKHKLFFAKLKEEQNFLAILSMLNWELLKHIL